VTEIERLTPDQLLVRLRPFAGGTDSYRKWDLMWIVENGDLLHALGIAQDPQRLQFRFVLRTGGRVTRTIAFIPKTSAPPAANAVRYWSPSPYDGETKQGWRAAIHKSQAPLYLRDPDRHFRAFPLSSLGAFYIQLRANADEGGEKLAPFVRSVSAQLHSLRPKSVILDLRFDTGGNIDLTSALMHEIANTTRGRVYLLIGRYTFSAGIAAAAIVKHDGGHHVTVIGEETADPLRWWSEIDVTCLPNSDLCLHGTHGLWDLVHGCSGEPGCYSDRFHAVVGNLQPDVLAPLTAATWLAGRDPAMEAIAQDLSKQPPG